jgi:drug/metabolite transporter (DMT)-like permease
LPIEAATASTSFVRSVNILFSGSGNGHYCDTTVRVIAIVLAALSALIWGTGDFGGGKASQRIPSLVAVTLSKAASLPLLGLYLVLLPATLHAASLAWGAVAGLFGAAAMIVFYRALAGGAMSIVAPLSAVTSALVPLVVGLLTQKVPGTLALIGAACAIAAIGLVSLVPRTEGAPGGLRFVVLGLVSGVGFGLFFVFLNLAGRAAGGHAGLWPVLGAHTASLVLGATLLGRSPAARVVPRGAPLAWVIMAGVFDMSANVLYLLAAQSGLLSIVAPVASLYPVTTVLLAMAVDKERMRPVQLAGLGLAATALVLVAS